MKRNALVMLLAVLSGSGTLRAGEVDADLAAKLQKANPNDVISTLVYLDDRVDLSAITAQADAQQATLAERHETVVLALSQKAQATQGQLAAHLNQLQAVGRIVDFEVYWVANVIRVDGVADEIIALAERNDVKRIYFNYPIELIAPVDQKPVIGQRTSMSGGVEPGVAAVRAPEVWNDLGITGDGVLVATLDTGVDGSHPALASRWRGLDPAYAGHPEWAFFDPVTNWQFPQDSASHGTHTMGSVCGGPPGDGVGVAPGAQWIHAAVIDRVNIETTVSDAILAFQWLIDPDGDPGTNFDVPAVCSNSWGLLNAHGYPECDETFWLFLDACEAAGIVMVFSAGNEGSAGLRRPSDRATDDYRTMAVAAVNANNPSFPIAGFSSRGPTACTPGGEDAIKPDIAAPGQSVRSSVPGGGYDSFSGTSMASPHINGVVALMREANPDISVEQIKQAIYDTATDLGSPGEDNDYGWGMVDAYEAVLSAVGTASLTFEFPDGRPEFVDPNGGTTITVLVSGQASPPVPGTGKFYYSAGGDFTELAMAEGPPNDYTATFPAFECGTEVSYYFSAETEAEDVVFNPFSAPVSTYSGVAYTGVVAFFADDFELDQGWTVVDQGGLTTGTWERGVPPGGDRGDPAVDADGSGQCYVTGLAEGDNDIDGGTTVLTSPSMDATDPEAVLSYFRWYSNDFGGDPENDIFVVDVSADGGESWTNLETVGPGGVEVHGGWFPVEFLIADLPGIMNTNEFRIRFLASDLNAGSVVEAGVDGVEIGKLYCEAPSCPADFDGNGFVEAADLAELLGSWGPCEGCPADLDGDGMVEAADLAELLSDWGPCPG